MSTHPAAEPAAAIQIACGGNRCAAKGRPLSRLASTAAHGSVQGSEARATTSAASTGSSGVPSGTYAASKVPPDAATTANPTATWSSEIRSAEPTAAAPETPARSASTDIAPICQIFPGT